MEKEMKKENRKAMEDENKIRKKRKEREPLPQEVEEEEDDDEEVEEFFAILRRMRVAVKYFKRGGGGDISGIAGGSHSSKPMAENLSSGEREEEKGTVKIKKETLNSIPDLNAVPSQDSTTSNSQK